LYRWHHKKALVRYSRLFADVTTLLNRLKDRGYKIAVGSNRPTRFSWILIRHLKIKKYFDYVLCADRLKHIKPHPQILNQIIGKFSLKPEQALYVGDMVIDAQAGRRAGIRTIIVTTGSSSRAQIKKEKPCRIIKRITGLAELLLKN
jgi:phosphoglycolate phosphatase